MKFSTIKALIGWAYQMSEAVPVKSAKYGEFTGAAFGGMTPNELKDAASDILVKVSRLPAVERAVVTAYFTGATKAINLAADTLPPMPTGLKRELVKGWAMEGLERTQAQIGESYCLSQPTVARRWNAACAALNGKLDTALATLEVQLLPLLSHPSRRNAHRTTMACAVA